MITAEESQEGQHADFAETYKVDAQEILSIRQSLQIIGLWQRMDGRWV
jgi:hypothetical protein